MSKHEKRQQAVALRSDGRSVKEIAKLLDIAQSTASLWVRDVKLSKENKRRIELIQAEGRKKAAETNRQKRLCREQKVIYECDVLKEVWGIVKNDAKVYLALLYWGEGAKTGNRVIMTNSDPDLMKTFVVLLRKSFKVDENKVRGVLHLHSYHNESAMISYWSECAGVDEEKISIYHKQESGITKKEGYKGCFSFRYGDVATFREIMLIIDRFKKVVYN